MTVKLQLLQEREQKIIAELAKVQNEIEAERRTAYIGIGDTVVFLYGRPQREYEGTIIAVSDDGDKLAIRTGAGFDEVVRTVLRNAIVGVAQVNPTPVTSVPSLPIGLEALENV